jgi:hypothetical protein
MANGWTPERRAKMAEIVRQWKPWEKSTGPVTAKGKRKTSKNASRSTRAIFKRGVRNILKASSELETNQETSLTGEALQIKGFGIDTTGTGEITELHNHRAPNPPEEASSPVAPAFPAGMVRSRYR